LLRSKDHPALPARQETRAPSGKGAVAASAQVKRTIFFDVVIALALGGAFLTGDFSLLANIAGLALITTAAIKVGVVQILSGKSNSTDDSSFNFWGKAYAVASVGMATAMGLLSCATFIAKTPASIGIAATIGVTGHVALAPLRETGRPRIVYFQAGCAVPPFILGLCFRWEFYTPVAIAAALGVAFAVIQGARRLARKTIEGQGSERKLAAAMDGVAQGLAMFDASSRFIAGNRRFNELTGLTAATAAQAPLDEWFAGKFARRLQDPADVQRLIDIGKEAVHHRSSHSIVLHLEDGRFLEFSFRPMTEGFSLLVDDVTLRRETEARLERMGRNDDVTGLANRLHFRERLEGAVAGGRDCQPFAVMVIDLDRFKQVNDSLGHPVGDKLLKKVAERLQKLAAPEDFVARLGGDEFVVLRTGAREDAGVFASRIVETMSQTFHIEDNRLMIGASVGVAMAPEDSAQSDELLKSADMALYAAKDAGRSVFRFFDNAMAEKARRRQQIEADLRAGIGRNELEVYYQPIVSIAKRRICCCEALVRWRHPTQGMISPGEFIPLAEESGLVAPLGEWVLRQACIDAKSWPREVGLAVNFSAVQFVRTDVVEMVKRILRETKFPAARLEMELTESVLMNDADSVLAAIDQLRDLGIRVALDDFGTGYSSLSYLSRFRPNKVKIDQAFVRDMAKNNAALAIIKAVKAMVCELGVDMLVEGVETLEQLDILRENGADEAQGYLFSKPRPAREIAQIVADPAQLVRGRKLILPPCAPWMKRYERVSPSVVRSLQ
jgi:diguanylate cyclase (GGDEF)-like protein